MQKKIIVVGVLLLLMIQITTAGFWEDRFGYQPGGVNFDDQECAVDLFGIIASRDRDRFRNETLGIGAGFTFFAARYFGGSVETYVDEFDIPNHVDFSAIVRYPIEEYSLAPYALAGFGRQFHEVSQWTSHLGGGVEFRLNRRTGLFADIRRIFPDDRPDLTLFRTGVRLKF
jgi:hypothetical protein